MAIGKLLLKLGIDTSSLDRELGKVEKSMMVLKAEFLKKA